MKELINNKRGRWQIDYSRHYKETANWRKTPLKERQRLSTHFLAINCKFSLYISRRKRQNDQWAIGWTNEHYNHDPIADPFLVEAFKNYEPGYACACQLASIH